MKLIKLTSEEELTKSVFTNNLAYPLTMPADSEIALKSLSFQFDSPEFTVDLDNNTFQFLTADNGTLRNVVLTPGVYKTNDFIAEIETKMNNAVMSDIDNVDVGFQWKVKTIFLKNELLLNIAYNKADNITIASSGTIYNNMTWTESGTVYKSGSDDAGKYNAHLINNVYVNRGGFKTTIQLDNQTVPGDITKTNFIWGLDLSGITMGLEQKDLIVPAMWCCFGTDGNGYYQVKKNNVMTATTIPIAPLDTLQIRKKDGKICYRVYKTSGTSEVIGDTINNGLLDLMGVSNNSYVLHIGNDSVAKTAFKTLMFTPNPNVQVSNGVYTINEDVPNVYLNTNLSATSSITTLFFSSPYIRNLLGFVNAIVKSPNGISYNFLGQEGLTLSFLTSDIEVEVLEITLDNYTQETRQRKNLIYNISQAELANSISTSGIEKYILSFYEQANFQFMSINNSLQPLRYSALTIRASCAGKEIDIKGRMSCTLLYKSKNENN